MATSIQDLDSRFPIVNEDGTPTDYFMRLINDRGNSQSENQESKVDKTTQIIAGNGLSGGGDLSQDRTLNLNATLDDLTDVDLTTNPPTDNQVLSYNSGSALWVPETVSGGSGSFSGARVYCSGTFTPVANSETVITQWDTEAFDDGDWWNISSPSNFVVPSGVTRVQANLYLRRTSSVADQFIGGIELYDSGGLFLGEITRSESDTAGGDAITCNTGPIDVTPGMTLKAVYFVTNSGNFDNGEYGSVFSVMALG